MHTQHCCVLAKSRVEKAEYYSIYIVVPRGLKRRKLCPRDVLDLAEIQIYRKFRFTFLLWRYEEINQIMSA